MAAGPNDRGLSIDATIEDIVAGLATEAWPPAIAIGKCLLHYQEAAPLLRAILIRAADGAVLSEQEETLLFCAVYIIGNRRDPEGFAPLLRLLHRPGDDVEYLLGDAVTEGLPRITTGMFDGNATALFKAIANLDLDEFVRDALFGAATFLAWEERIARAQMVRFLERFHAERLAPSQDMAWFSWQRAVALLGVRPLAPAVESAFHDGTIPDQILEYKEFIDDLERAERDPGDIGRFKDEYLGHMDDVLGALQRFVHADDEEPEEPNPSWSDPLGLPAGAIPALNPFRDVGRNDPCPCGSGKKAKRCCLAA